MASTHRDASVTAEVAQIAGDVREQLLQVRRVYLKGRAPKSPYVHQLRRQIAAEQKKPVEHLLALSFADIDDGIPASLVAQAYLTIVALLEERADARAARRSLPILGANPLPLIQQENRVQYEGDVLERELIEHPDNVAVIDRRLENSARYREVSERLDANLRARRARVTAAVSLVSR